LRVHATLVVRERLQLGVGQELQLGDANAVLARDHAVQAAGQHHDALHRTVRGLQHFIVVAVDRDVGMHIAVAGMHVQGHPHTPLEHPLVHPGARVHDRLESCAGEDRRQRVANLGLPARTQGVVLQLRKQHRHILQPPLPERANVLHHCQRLRHTVFQQFGRGNPGGIVLLAQRKVAMAEKGSQFISTGQSCCAGSVRC
jgi:hypothetical protein